MACLRLVLRIQHRLAGVVHVVPQLVVGVAAVPQFLVSRLSPRAEGDVGVELPLLPAEDAAVGLGLVALALLVAKKSGEGWWCSGERRWFRSRALWCR